MARVSTINKIRRLSESDNAGERQAAQEALKRLGGRKPFPGSPEWSAAMREHAAIIGFCSVHRDNPALTSAELATLKRWVRYVGSPWEAGSEELLRIHNKLKEEQPDADTIRSLPGR